MFDQTNNINKDFEQNTPFMQSDRPTDNAVRPTYTILHMY